MKHCSKFSLTLLGLFCFLCSCKLNGGIDDKMYLCRRYSFTHATSMIDDEEVKNDELTAIINTDVNFTYCIFRYDGTFEQSTDFTNEYLRIITKGTYYQTDYDIFMTYDDGTQITAIDRPFGISDVTPIKVPTKLTLGEEEKEVFLYYKESIYHPCNL